MNAAAAADVAADRRRRRPAWVPTIAAFATIALCLTAASWQHRRMLEKEALQQAISAAATAPAVPLPPAVTDWPRWRFRTVTLKGEFDARHQILIDNAQHAGRVGFGVVTPFVLDDGRKVLVQDDALPDTGIEKHLSYMLQWLTFAAMAAGLWLWFTVRPWLRHRSTAG